MERALGGRRGAPTHPATRVFQALRIAVNDELGELEEALEAAERVLVAGGRLAVVTFHSLEDRIVKAFFTERAGRTPARLAPPASRAKGPRIHLRAVVQRRAHAVPAEIAANPRARSAKLRAAERTAAPAWKAAGMSAARFLRRTLRGARLVELGALTVMLALALAVYTGQGPRRARNGRHHQRRKPDR